MFKRVLIAVTGLGLLVFLLKGGCVPSATRQPGDRIDRSRTVVVASWSDPVSDSRNAMWCSALLVAGDELRDAGAQIDQTGLAKLLEEDGDGRDTLRDEDYFSFGAGLTDENREAILDEAHERLQRRFPDQSFPRDWDSRALFIGYTFLSVVLEFERPYFEVDPVVFPNGHRQDPLKVRSFGFDRSHRVSRPRARVLYSGHIVSERRVARAVVDLDPEGDIEVWIADAPEGRSLRDAWRDVERRVALGDPHPSIGRLAVPELDFSKWTQYPELLPPKFGSVQQKIDFRLDRYGVELEVEVRAEGVKDGAGGDIDYIFDGPFLLSLRVRGRTDPFFLLWVRNADLCLAP